MLSWVAICDKTLGALGRLVNKNTVSDDNSLPLLLAFDGIRSGLLLLGLTDVFLHVKVLFFSSHLENLINTVFKFISTPQENSSCQLYRKRPFTTISCFIANHLLPTLVSLFNKEDIERTAFERFS